MALREDLLGKIKKYAGKKGMMVPDGMEGQTGEDTMESLLDKMMALPDFNPMKLIHMISMKAAGEGMEDEGEDEVEVEMPVAPMPEGEAVPMAPAAPMM